MKFEIQRWTVKELLDLYKNGKLNLNPPYQRNPIWTKKAQRQLIDSIKQNFPIPSFFVFKRGDSYEMVDGQQRTRALLAFSNTEELDDKSDSGTFKKGAFLDYEISVTLITRIDSGEHIEQFYDLVNSQGLRLNRPETLKAKYFNTKFLELVENLTATDDFQDLELVPPNSQKRMQDRDLVEELVALLLFGITDKKIQVDKIYEDDITPAKVKEATEKFNDIVDHLKRFNSIKPLKDTRYRQRNDLYSLFGFLKDLLGESKKVLDYFYRILIVIDPEIRPSKAACPPFQNYAYACVSQSNSAASRKERHDILVGLFLNEGKRPNDTQKEVLDFYSLTSRALVAVGSYRTFETTALKGAIVDKAKETEEQE